LPPVMPFRDLMVLPSLRAVYRGTRVQVPSRIGYHSAIRHAERFIFV
jgi:hypothetical protein